MSANIGNDRLKRHDNVMTREMFCNGIRVAVRVSSTKLLLRLTHYVVLKLILEWPTPASDRPL